MAVWGISLQNKTRYRIHTASMRKYFSNAMLPFSRAASHLSATRKVALDTFALCRLSVKPPSTMRRTRA
ncbi:hypothetical protein N9F34_01190 [Alphaproteobacteria bacterium]|nr:hypothetical protein [Alphaproteobacteria bacterium]